MATSGQFDPRPRFLMCRPRHFAVTYSINPWMDPAAWHESGDALHATAMRQWQGLFRALHAGGASVELVEPQDGLPDLVFTANSAVVLDGRALLARFRHPQRQVEEPVFAAAFHALRARGLIDDVTTLPPGVTLEGAGDCLWDAHRRLFWMGCGFRSGVEAREIVSAQFGVPCVALALADPTFYHLDTCFSPLPCGAVMYYPAAFTTEGLALIHARAAPTIRYHQTMPRALPPMQSPSAAPSCCRAAARRCGPGSRSAAIQWWRRRSQPSSAAAAQPVA